VADLLRGWEGLADAIRRHGVVFEEEGEVGFGIDGGGRDARGRFLRGSGGVAWIVTRRDATTGRKSQAGEFKREAGKVKPGRYMANGLDKVRPKIPKAFANFVSGP
jgi:hypothetical protein